MLCPDQPEGDGQKGFSPEPCEAIKSGQVQGGGHLLANHEGRKVGLCNVVLSLIAIYAGWGYILMYLYFAW